MRDAEGDDQRPPPKVASGTSSSRRRSAASSSDARPSYERWAVSIAVRRALMLSPTMIILRTGSVVLAGLPFYGQFLLGNWLTQKVTMEAGAWPAIQWPR